MTKRHFIALADAIKEHNDIRFAGDPDYSWFNQEQLDVLANFCQAQNPRFNRKRWLGYIAGTNGKNGGKR